MPWTHTPDCRPSSEECPPRMRLLHAVCGVCFPKSRLEEPTFTQIQRLDEPKDDTPIHERDPVQALFPAGMGQCPCAPYAPLCPVRAPVPQRPVWTRAPYAPRTSTPPLAFVGTYVHFFTVLNFGFLDPCPVWTRAPYRPVPRMPLMLALALVVSVRESPITNSPISIRHYFFHHLYICLSHDRYICCYSLRRIHDKSLRRAAEPPTLSRSPRRICDRLLRRAEEPLWDEQALPPTT